MASNGKTESRRRTTKVNNLKFNGRQINKAIFFNHSDLADQFVDEK